MDQAWLKRRILLAISLAAVLGGAQLCSADAASDNTMDSLELGETVVTATRTKLEEKQVPMAVQVIKADEMKKKGAYNVRDAIKNATGIDVSRNGTSMVGNNVSVRGMGTTETLILVDGRRIAGEDSASTMNAYELDRINVNQIDRVEILRGSGSAVWGSDATGGVINIITKKNKPQGGYAGTRTGSLESSVYGGFSTGDMGKLNMNFDFNLTKVRKEDNNGSTNMYGPRRNLSVNGNYRFNDHSGLDFGASFMKEQLTSLSASTTAGTTTSYYDNNRSDYHVKYYGFDRKNDWEIQSYYSRLGKVGRTRTAAAWNDFNHARYSTWVNEAKNTYKMDKNNTLTYGMEVKNQKAGGTRFANPGGGTRIESYLGMTSPYGSASQTSYAFYLEDEMKLGDKLLFIPSVRFDHHDSFGSEWSPPGRAHLQLQQGQPAESELRQSLPGSHHLRTVFPDDPFSHCLHAGDRGGEPGPAAGEIHQLRHQPGRGERQGYRETYLLPQQDFQPDRFGKSVPELRRRNPDLPVQVPERGQGHL